MVIVALGGQLLPHELVLSSSLNRHRCEALPEIETTSGLELESNAILDERLDRWTRGAQVGKQFFCHRGIIL